jgi:DNA-binding IclR family transcriptional regulator
VSQYLTADAPVNQSVERAARLLGFFTPEEPALTLADLTARLGASRATTHRYTLALRRVGLIRYDPGTATYALGPRAVELAAAALAGPTMERLLAAANETVVLSVSDGGAPVVVRVEDNTDRLVRIVVRTGARLPRETSAQGKVFCAFGAGGEADLDAAELATIRRTRIATNSQLVQGIRAIATPVFQDREAVAALALVGTTASIPDDPAAPLARLLVEAAATLSAELGFLRSERSA